MRENPVEASGFGDLRYNDRWPDLSPAAMKARNTANEAALEKLQSIPRDALSPTDRINYDLFQREYGLTIARAEERIDAVAASVRDARDLDIAPGTPLLRIDRRAYALDDQPIEWRVSLCHLKGMHYLATLR